MSQSEAQTIRVWIVEDNAAYRRGVAQAINSTEGMICDQNFGSVESLLAIQVGSDEAPDVVLLDVQLPGSDGISAIDPIAGRWPDARSVILTAFNDTDKIFRALCAGASGYLLKASDRATIEAAIREVVAGGAPMTPSVARKVIDLFSRQDRGKMDAPQSSGNPYKLTEREHETLALMAEGLVKKEIADQLSISPHTVNTHIRSIYEKLHVSTNTGAVAKAIRERII